MLLAYAEDIHISSSALLSPAEIFRYGFIPRAFDSERDEVETGSIFSLAIGGSSHNSVSFTAIGSVYAVGGYLWVMVGSVMVSWGISVALRRDGPWWWAIAILAADRFLWIGTYYPNNVIAFCQGLTSLAFVYLGLYSARMFRRHAFSQPDDAISRPLPIEALTTTPVPGV